MTTTMSATYNYESKHPTRGYNMNAFYSDETKQCTRFRHNDIAFDNATNGHRDIYKKDTTTNNNNEEKKKKKKKKKKHTTIIIVVIIIIIIIII